MRLLLALLLCAGSAWAQEGIPNPGMPEGAVQTGASDRSFDIYELPVGRFTATERPVEVLEGRVVFRSFRLDDGEITTSAVMDGLRMALEERGFEAIFLCDEASCGDFDFRFGITVMAAPAMIVDLADFRQLSMRRDQGQPVHVSILVSRALGAIYGQTVVVVPGENTVKREPAPEVTAGQGAAPRATAEEADALRDRLMENGHVVLRGIAFATGSARIADASAPMLDLLAMMLKANPELSVAVVGHTDSAGGYETNLRLSRARASSVVDALVARGVERARLEAHGAAYLAPIASNATAEGRALNRRVELVLR